VSKPYFSLQSIGQSRNVDEFALPNHNRSPTQLRKCGKGIRIAEKIGLEFLLPECFSGFRHRGLSAIWMAVPKTSVNENYRMPPWQHDIGLPRQMFGVKSESKSDVMQYLPNGFFGSGVSTFHCPHDFRTFFSGRKVHSGIRRFGSGSILATSRRRSFVSLLVPIHRDREHVATLFRRPLKTAAAIQSI
jgi:hypothetical protein